MTDIDAIAKDMPRIKRIAERMENILNDPFVAGTAAERADALADLNELRAFRDELPQVRQQLDSLDTLIRDVADLKNRPVFDPSDLPQASTYAGVTEDRVKELIGEAMPSTVTVKDVPETSAPLTAGDVEGIAKQVLTSSAVAEHLESLFAEDLAARDAKIADFATRLDDALSKIEASSALTDRLNVAEAKLTALMDALDVNLPDLGKDRPQDQAAEGNGADAAELTGEGASGSGTASTEAEKPPQDPS